MPAHQTPTVLAGSTDLGVTIYGRPVDGEWHVYNSEACARDGFAIASCESLADAQQVARDYLRECMPD